jgi:hypothetical protein
MTIKLNNDNGLQTQWTERQLVITIWQKWRFIASYDSFEVQQTAVVRINIGDKNRNLRQAANRLCAYASYRSNTS